MKKIFLTLALVLMATGIASARLVGSNLVQKKESPTQWFVRAGLSINNMAGGYDFYDNYQEYEEDAISYGSKAGYDFSVGFMKPIKTSGLYWGMELGFGTEGFTAKGVDGDDEISLLGYNVKYTPLMVGFK